MNSVTVMQAFRGLPEFEVRGESGVGRGPSGPADVYLLKPVVQAAREEGYEMGYAAGIEKSKSEMATLLSSSATEFEARLASEKEHWLEEIGARLSGDVTHAMAALARSLFDQIGEVMLPFVKKLIRESAYRDLESELARAISAGSKVSIGGPPNLVQPLNELLNSRGIAATCSASDQTSLRIDIDDTTIVSTIEAWFLELENTAT